MDLSVRQKGSFALQCVSRDLLYFVVENLDQLFSWFRLTVNNDEEDVRKKIHLFLFDLPSICRVLCSIGWEHKENILYNMTL